MFYIINILACCCYYTFGYVLFCDGAAETWHYSRRGKYIHLFLPTHSRFFFCLCWWLNELMQNLPALCVLVERSVHVHWENSFPLCVLYIYTYIHRHTNPSHTTGVSKLNDSIYKTISFFFFETWETRKENTTDEKKI